MHTLVQIGNPWHGSKAEGRGHPQLAQIPLSCMLLGSSRELVGSSVLEATFLPTLESKKQPPMVTGLHRGVLAPTMTPSFPSQKTMLREGLALTFLM